MSLANKCSIFIHFIRRIANQNPYGLLGALGYIVLEFFLGGYARLRVTSNQFSEKSNDETKYQNPYNLKKKGYIIWAPDYKTNSAGIRCLYQLCNDLNLQGYPSFIVGAFLPSPNNLNAPLIGWGSAKKLINQGFIAVYPEVVKGNPLGANRVARWVLNKPGLLGGDLKYASNEKIFYYSNAYRDAIQNEIVGQLLLPTLDEEIFYSDGRPPEARSLSCFYIGKSKWKDGYFDRSETLEITRQFPHRRDLGHLLRSAKVLYCFDNSTALCYEALLCGCPVVIIPDGTQTKHDYENSELGMEGIAWGLEELSNAKPNPKALGSKVKKQLLLYNDQLFDFIQKTQLE